MKSNPLDTYRLNSRSLMLLFLVFMSSCSSVITKEDCKKDMLQLGIDHGKKGLTRLTDDVRSTCVSGEQTVDLENYETGFNRGWSTYCTTFNGFDMGRRGDLYKSFCPIEKEDLFREKFLIGKKVYEKKDQVLEIEDKIQELNDDLEKDVGNITLKEELKKLQDFLLAEKRAIQALEQQGTSLIHTN